MFLSAADKDSGIVPGPYPARVRINIPATQRFRRENHWRRFQLGDIAPVDVTPAIDLSTGTFSPPPIDFVTVTPSIFDTNPIPSLPAFVTPTAPDIPAPSFTVADQPAPNVVPTTPTPGASTGTVAPTTPSPDYFGDILKLAQVAGQTFVGYTAAQHGLPPGVTGITPGAPLTGGPLSPAQLAMMTPAQRAQYAVMYPGTGAASPTDFLSTLLGTGAGGPSLTTIMLWGGVGLVAFVLLTRKQGKA